MLIYVDLCVCGVYVFWYVRIWPTPKLQTVFVLSSGVLTKM